MRAQRVSSGDHGRDPHGGSGSLSTAFAQSRALVTRFLEERSSGEAGLWTLRGQGGPRTAKELGGAGRSCSGAGRKKGRWKKAPTCGPGWSERGKVGAGERCWERSGCQVGDARQPNGANAGCAGLRTGLPVREEVGRARGEPGQGGRPSSFWVGPVSWVGF